MHKSIRSAVRKGKGGTSGAKTKKPRVKTVKRAGVLGFVHEVHQGEGDATTKPIETPGLAHG
jgi:hypothetical protein